MTRMDALIIIKQEIYKDTIPSVEVQNALDCLEEYITNSRVKVTSEALANIRKNTLKEFVEYVQNYDSDYIIDTHEDIRRHYKPPIHISIGEVLENFLKERENG